MAELKRLAAALACHQPTRAAAFASLAVAAVALILRDDPQQGLSVLMIERAQRAGDPWSGHMAFPGGVREAGDFHPLHTAIRETREETGLDVRQMRCLGQLSERRTHRSRSGNRPPMRIRPYVFAAGLPQAIRLNPEAVDSIWLPLSFLVDPVNRQTMHWHWKGSALTLPCYVYQGKRIWGLSLQMLDELQGLQ